MPSTLLYGYGLNSRETSIRELGFDPVDFDYPYGTPSGLPIKEPKLVASLIKHRLDQAAMTVKLVVNESDKFKKSVFALCQADAYSLSGAARAATMSDWARWALENPNLKIVLSLPSTFSDPVGNYLSSLSFAKSVGISFQQLGFVLRDVETDLGFHAKIQKTYPVSPPVDCIAFEGVH